MTYANATPAHRAIGFRIHAISFVATIAALVVINLLTGSYFWAGWVIASWSIGLVSHWLFAVGPFAGKHANS